MDKQTDLHRREFGKLGMAALAGIAAGSAIGCGQQPAAESGAAPAPVDAKATTAPSDATASATSSPSEPPADAAASATTTAVALHLCRGLNLCKGQGKEGANECAGRGDCATEVEHLCGGQNECKGRGGCGPEPAANDCKGQGHCAVPLMDSAWKKLRKRFETDMAEKKIEFGPAPAKKS